MQKAAECLFLEFVISVIRFDTLTGPRMRRKRRMRGMI